MDYESDYFFDPQYSPRFRCDRFSSVVSAAAATAGIRCGCRLSTLTPMGFEVLNDDSYFDRHLTRFYVYLFADCPALDARKIELVFLNELLRRCEEIDPRFAASVVVNAARTGVHNLRRPHGYQWQSKDRLIVAEYRGKVFSPLHDYASYLAACIEAIPNASIPEVQRFKIRKMARTRIFQIAVILERALAQECLSCDLFSQEMRTFMQRHRSLPIFYFDPQVIEEPTPQELCAWRAVNKAMKLLASLVKESSGMLDLHVKAFHGDDYLTFTIGRSHFECFVRQIERSYHRVWGDA